MTTPRDNRPEPGDVSDPACPAESSAAAAARPAAGSPDVLRGLPLCAILGPTAVGKSALALSVAERAGAEIVSLDSMQVYRGMDIGTAKPSAAERARVPHHMIDLVETDERYDVQRFLRDLAPVLDGIRERGGRALFVGGTGFYLKILTAGLFEGPAVDPNLRAELMRRARDEGHDVLHAELALVDPKSAAKIHAHDTKRVVRGLEVFLQTGRALSEWQVQWNAEATPRAERRLLGIEIEVEELDRRIAQRARQMLDAGWPAEAAAIRAGRGFGETAVQALGYAEALAVHDRELDSADAARKIALATRQFARKQRTWYRKFDDVRWVPAARDGDTTQCDGNTTQREGNTAQREGNTAQRDGGAAQRAADTAQRDAGAASPDKTAQRLPHEETVAEALRVFGWNVERP